MNSHKGNGHVCVHAPTDPTDTEILLGCCDSGAGEDPVNGFDQEKPATLPVKFAPGLELEGFTRGPEEVEEVAVVEMADGSDFRDGIMLHDPDNPERSRTLQDHPERREGEIYLIRVTKVGFDLMPWKTKRLGAQADCGCYPVFVAQSELELAGYRIIEPESKRQSA